MSLFVYLFQNVFEVADDGCPVLELALSEVDVRALEISHAVLRTVIDDVVATVQVFMMAQDEPFVGILPQMALHP